MYLFLFMIFLGGRETQALLQAAVFIEDAIEVNKQNKHTVD